MPNSNFFMFTQSQTDSNVTELRIDGEVGSEWWNDTVEREFVRKLDAVNTGTIRVKINSPGGDVFSGFSIYNNLKKHNSRVEVEVLGLAGSVSSVIAMAGDVVRMPRTASIMIHNPFTPYTSGEAKDLRSRADALDKMKEMALAAYTSKAKITKEKISEMMDNTIYLTADEALEYGFIDEIIETDEGITIDGDMLNCAGTMFKMSAFKGFPKEKFPKKIQTQPTGGEEMTKEQLMQQYPELFKQIIAVGIMQERERLQAIDKLPVVQGAEAVVMKAKYEDMSSAADLAIKLLEENARMGANHMNGIKNDLQPVKVEPTVNPVNEEQKLIDDAIAMMRGGK
ncbi:head maturation protease, ClpP-related [Cetobacterium somerae]|uniref:head maturation protease, ClpP-related n=1 Tax=Cetobacterium somerae TaxID=188913 RepID=UPI0038924A26